MAYDRYDARGGARDERSRWSDDRSQDRGWNRERRQEHEDERGFFERAGDEIASWFGNDDQDRRDERAAGWDRGDGRGYPASPRGQDRDYDRSSNRSRGYRDEGYEQSRGYRPMAGDYGRSEEFFAASGYGVGERGIGGYDRSETPWGRDDYRRTSRAGTSDRSNRSQHRSRHEGDPHYHEWRQRHLDELDRDYDEYRREHQSKFEKDFGSWRERRQQKRGLLVAIREHMEVVGKDDEHVGTVDKIAGDRIILTKSDPDSGGVHHSLSCSDIDRVDDERVILDCSADEARERWRDENRSRALFEREDQGEMGPRVLDRSFEGTYRDR